MIFIKVLVAIIIFWVMWRPLSAAVSPAFAVAYPDLTQKLRLSITLAVVLLVLTFVLLPFLILPVGAAALIFLTAEKWRARASWGERKGLPPGSLRIFTNTWSDDRFYLKQAALHGPIFKTSNFLRPAACIVGLERGIQLLREEEEKLETPWLPFSEYVPGGMLRYMREPQHQLYRSIFRRALAPRIIKQFEPVFEEYIRLGLKAMATQSSASSAGINPLPQLDQMMLELWLGLFFAIERDSPEWKLLLALYPVIDIANPRKASPQQVRDAVSDIENVVKQQLERWRDEAPPCLLAAILEDDPSQARDPVVIGNLIYMLTTTGSDMSALFCWILKKACDNPEWLERVASESQPANVSASLPLADRFVMETLRMRQSEFIYRAVVRDIDFHGYRIPKGWLLRICVWESHRNPDVFPEPDRFNPDRFLNRSYTRNEYSPFGASTHACLAQYLVTLVASIFVRELAAGFELTSPSRSSPELASSRHWAPGAAFRIDLKPQ